MIGSTQASKIWELTYKVGHHPLETWVTSHYHHTWELRQRNCPKQKEQQPGQREQCLRQREQCPREREQCLRQRKSIPDKGNSVPDRGNNVPDRGNNVSNKGKSVPDRGNSVLDRRNSIPQKGNCSKQHPRQKEQYLGRNSVLDRRTVPQTEKITSQTEGTYSRQRKQCSNRGKGTKASKIEPGHL